MMRFGGGLFGYVELFPIGATPGNYDDLGAVNDHEFPDRGFLAVAPVGTGDFWGFPVIDGSCLDAVWCRYHDVDDDDLVAADFLDFVAESGLKSCADRALERRD
jgi:antitoxin YobK